MGDITKIKVNGNPESSYQLYPRNEEFAKRSGGGNAGSQSGVQSDWNQNDATKPDYVKNRPFYTGAPVETVIVEESTASFVNDGDNIYAADFPSTFSAKVGETYKVYWDGTVYECVCVSVRDLPTIGNPSIQGDGSDTGEPFCIVVFSSPNMLIYAADTSAYHTFSISKLIPGEVIKIDKKYLPTPEYIIPSSTSGSTKKFKITVDDSGAITATEVT